jgi:DNA-binding NarL/FixJ family response regulator
MINLWDRNIGAPEIIPLIKRKSPVTAVVLFTSKDDAEYLCRAISCGVAAYLLRPHDNGRLISAIRMVHQGYNYISPNITTKTFSIITELQVISCVGRGQSSREIAECLRLRPGTVRNCISSSMRKAGLSNRTQLAICAFRLGLVSE